MNLDRSSVVQSGPADVASADVGPASAGPQSTLQSVPVIPLRLNLTAHLLDARLAEGHGARPAVRTRSETLSYADVARLSSQYAHILTDDDIRPEERVIVALPDGPDYVAALFGILRRGSVVVMVNPDASPDLIRYFLEYTRATAAFVPVDRLDLFVTAAARPPQ